MVRFHGGMPRLDPDRYVEITVQPELGRIGWYSVTLAIHDEENDIEIEVMGETMTSKGAMQRAAELAQRRRIEDVIWRHQPYGRTTTI